MCIGKGTSTYVVCSISIDSHTHIHIYTLHCIYILYIVHSYIRIPLPSLHQIVYVVYRYNKPFNYVLPCVYTAINTFTYVCIYEWSRRPIGIRYKILYIPLPIRYIDTNMSIVGTHYAICL